MRTGRIDAETYLRGAAADIRRRRNDRSSLEAARRLEAKGSRQGKLPIIFMLVSHAIRQVLRWMQNVLLLS